MFQAVKVSTGNRAFIKEAVIEASVNGFVPGAEWELRERFYHEVAVELQRGNALAVSQWAMLCHDRRMHAKRSRYKSATTTARPLPAPEHGIREIVGEDFCDIFAA